MSKQSKFETGFAFGKYCPLHNGHVNLINFGRSLCDSFYVLVCGSNQEAIATRTRADWVREELGSNSGVIVVEYSYDESLLPNTSESDRDVSQIWSDIFRQLLPRTVGLIVTSEPYGEFVAQCMNIEHVCYDQKRSLLPISSTLRRSYQKLVVITGTESAGKTTMAAALVQHYMPSDGDSDTGTACADADADADADAGYTGCCGAALVAEAAREIIADSNDFDMSALMAVAQAQAANITTGRALLRPLVVVDTDVYVTQSYASHAFGEQLELDQSLYEASRADLRLFLVAAGVPFEQDGTRLGSEELRRQLDRSHRETLRRYGQPFVELHGTFAERFREAVTLIDAQFGFP